MSVFIDTSSLVKLYAAEDGAAEVERMVEALAPAYVAWLALPEFYSALWRKVRAGVIDDAERAVFEKEFRKDWGDALSVVPFDDGMPERAVAILQRVGREKRLKTLDALQLASGQTCHGARFLTADQDLAACAALIGLPVAVGS
ncbi:MAG: type II toxin-antitoxin system VapC family toxin [Planctomycetes bacterium]|nr:type II toxin-antitoxin system VapC family toxin [Planctomycetota bacterium]